MRTRPLVSLLASALILLATGMALAPGTAAAASSGTAYVAGSGTVTPINLATNTPGTPIPAGAALDGIAVTPASGGVPVPTGAIGGILLTGLVALVFVGYQLTRSRTRRQTATS